MDFGSFYLGIRESICKIGFHIHAIQVKMKLGTKFCIFGSRGSGHVAPRGHATWQQVETPLVDIWQLLHGF